MSVDSCLDNISASYLSLYYNHELQKRVSLALRMLGDCRICPRACSVDRLCDQTGDCSVGRYAYVSAYFPHFGEEDCLRGTNGSGTIFFSLCNLHCVFCQNVDISQHKSGSETSPLQLAQMMLELQEWGCHNVNWVSPDHIVPQLLEALLIAVEGGLTIPIVYNSSAYTSLEILRLLDGVVDVYLPDFKFWDSALSRRYLRASDYPQTARAAINEMHRQVGTLQFDDCGIARRGLLVRHLVMPGYSAETESVLRFLAEEISPDTYVSLMDQYHPGGSVNMQKYAEINRIVSSEEYRAACEAGRRLRLHHLL